ncbi:MAG: hypothetical protein V4819_07170 [Verrucomicrobiota bacterium]
MKTKALIIAGTGLLLSATALVLNPSAPSSFEANKPLNFRTQSSRREANHPPANLTVNRQHPGAPLEKHVEPEAAAKADTIAAETQYAEAASDPASRIALLWLDREREVRAEAALAFADPTEQSQAMAELETWYEDGRGAIVASNEIE